MKKKILIEGMSCNHCVNHVKEALNELKGVSAVLVSLDTKSAEIEVVEGVKDEDIKAAIDEAGYEVVEIKAV